MRAVPGWLGMQHPALLREQRRVAQVVNAQFAGERQLFDRVERNPGRVSISVSLDYLK